MFTSSMSEKSPADSVPTDALLSSSWLFSTNCLCFPQHRNYPAYPAMHQDLHNLIILYYFLCANTTDGATVYFSILHAGVGPGPLK